MPSKMHRWNELLIRSLEDQGCRIRLGNDGQYVIYPPKGGMFTIHGTPSDRRSEANMRGTLRQHGLRWPFPKSR